MKPLFIQYNKCGTCQKASKWIKNHQLDVTIRDIIQENPSAQELTEWISRSGLPVNKFFNTSGLRYKELNLKDVVKKASQEELIQLLASEGKLVKRPILITDHKVLVGFKEAEWEEIL